MGKLGRNLAEKEFNLKNVVDRHIKIYYELFLKHS